MPATPDWISTTDSTYERYGIVDGAGDVNGDGYDDVLVGDPWYDGSGLDSGRVELYYGAPSGLADQPDWTVEWGLDDQWYGGRPRGLGDVNGDGYSDVAISDPFWDNEAGDNVGAVQVYLGSPAGLPSTADWVYESGQPDDQLGWDVDAAGDVNGDGYSDMIVGAPGFDGSRGGRLPVLRRTGRLRAGSRLDLRRRRDEQLSRLLRGRTGRRRRGWLRRHRLVVAVFLHHRRTGLAVSRFGGRSRELSGLRPVARVRLRRPGVGRDDRGRG